MHQVYFWRWPYLLSSWRYIPRITACYYPHVTLPRTGARWSVTDSPPVSAACVRQVKTNSTVDRRSWSGRVGDDALICRHDDVTRQQQQLFFIKFMSLTMIIDLDYWTLFTGAGTADIWGSATFTIARASANRASLHPTVHSAALYTTNSSWNYGNCSVMYVPGASITLIGNVCATFWSEDSTQLYCDILRYL